MEKLRKLLFGIVSAAITVCCCTIMPQQTAYADESSVDYRLAITPTQKGFGVLKPGETYSDIFKVKNSGDKAFDFSISFAPYGVEGENYSVNYDKVTQYNDIVNWLTVDTDSGTVEPGGEAEITYSFTVPDDAHGGAQLATIMVAMGDTTDDNSGGLEAIRRLGYIVYGNVDGDIIETGKVLENKVPGFLFNPPILGSSTVENTGNVYTRATYKLQVFPLFSDEEVYTNEENPENNIIFPETKRYNEIKWEGSPHLGIFRVRQTVKIFDEESVTEKIVFLCPIWFLFIVILLIFLIIFWIVSRIIKRGREA